MGHTLCYNYRLIKVCSLIVLQYGVFRSVIYFGAKYCQFSELMVDGLGWKLSLQQHDLEKKYRISIQFPTDPALCCLFFYREKSFVKHMTLTLSCTSPRRWICLTWEPGTPRC